MLLQFSVESFLSFDEEQVFSMVATGDDQHSEHLITNVPRKGESVLRGAAIYGANAAGKSNLVRAISFARDRVLNGSRSGQALPFRPFKLKSVGGDRPSRFEFVIQTQGVLYNYGFRADVRRIHEEWLFATPNKQEIKYFQRVSSTEGKVEVEFGPSLGGGRKGQEQFLGFVAQATRPNELFLTKAVDNNVVSLKPLFDWFDTSLLVIPTETVEMNLAVRATKGSDFARFLGTFLHQAGTGIERVETKPDAEPTDLTSDFPAYDERWRQAVRVEAVRAEAYGSGPGEVIRCQGPDGEPSQFQFGEDGQWHHAPLKLWHGAEGESVAFDMAEQSDGTRRLMDLASTLYQMRELPEQVVIIDELDRRLHTLLSRLFVQTALDCDEAQQSQLIFTTHDTNLLDLDLLRRDEIWFVEKDKGGASHLRSLAEYKIRPDFKAEKGYLSGRFGALPFYGDPGRLGLVCRPDDEAGGAKEQASVGKAA